MQHKVFSLTIFIAIFSLFLVHCSADEPAAEPPPETVEAAAVDEIEALTSQPTEAATHTPTAEPTIVPTETPVPTATLEPTPEPSPTEKAEPTPTAEPVVVNGNTYYVSKEGNNEDGRSWETAWNELDQIDWQIIQPGDVIVLDGGPTEMVYETVLDIDQSGSSDEPITIKLAEEAGRDGQAVFFGGRANDLPYCFQQDYVDESDTIEIPRYGVLTNGHSWIVLDGTKWRGIAIHGFKRNGIRISRDSTNLLFKYLEIYNNGLARYDEEEGWRPDEPGVRLAGENVTFKRVIVHDNGQDAFQSLWDENNLANFRLEESWIYNGRRHPTVDESSNYCTHADGIHIYDGQVVKGVTIVDSIIGPGFTQSIILGQTPTSSGSWADVQDVTLSNVLIMKAADNSILGYRRTQSENWNIDHITVHCPKTKQHCITIDNASHSVTNSIFYGGKVTFKDGLDNFSGNCQWNTTGFEIGQNVDPQFVNISNEDHFSLDDYSLEPDSPCLGAGSRITSVEQLLNLPPDS